MCVCVCVCVCVRVPVEKECFGLATPFKSRLHRSVLPVIKSTTVNMLQLRRQNNLSAFSKLSILWRRGNVYYLSFNLSEKWSLYHSLQKSSVHSQGCSFFRCHYPDCFQSVNAEIWLYDRAHRTETHYACLLLPPLIIYPFDCHDL